MKKTSNNEDDIAYLRPETAQAIFLEYKNILDSTRMKIPFGIAQIGKAFRNEITPKNFIFRTIEFEQMEIEYFIREKDWEKYFEFWLEKMKNWCSLIGLNPKKINIHEHSKKELSHYSKKTVDITYDFPFGKHELYGLAYRTDFDLKQHAKYSKTSQEYIDQEERLKFIPHVIEPTFGLDRTILALLCDAYDVETLKNNEKRTVLHFSTKIAPIKVAVFPLMNELGTPFCVTIDYETLEDDSVTIRERDSMEQKRIKIDNLVNVLNEKI
jgi:glycyl-tRNA synthetase